MSLALALLLSTADAADRPVRRLRVLPLRALTGLANAMVGDGPLPIRTQAYGDEHLHVLDRILPPAGVEVLAPVVYIHGGGWICGSRKASNEAISELALAGHPVFNVDYPLAPEAPHPEPLLALLEALSWIQAEYPALTADGVHLVGDSAGGNLAVMLAALITDPELRDALPAGNWDVPAVRSASSLYGVMDRLTWLEDGFPNARLYLRAYAGPDAFADRVEPPLAITPMDLDIRELPPIFLGVGDKDPLQRSSRLFAETLEARELPVEHHVYEGARHGFYTFGPGTALLRADLQAFLAAH